MYRTLLTRSSPCLVKTRHPRTGEYDWTFPRLIICSNSMHSKQKLLRYGMDQGLIEQFYGSYEEYAGMNRSEWKEIVRKRLIHFVWKLKIDFIRLFHPMASVIPCDIWDQKLKNTVSYGIFCLYSISYRLYVIQHIICVIFEVPSKFSLLKKFQIQGNWSEFCQRWNAKMEFGWSISKNKSIILPDTMSNQWSWL